MPFPSAVDEGLAEIDTMGHDPKSPRCCPTHDIRGQEAVGTANVEEVAVAIDGFHQG
jgi:hypothetical protein